MKTRLALIFVFLAGVCNAGSQPPVWKYAGSRVSLMGVISIDANDKGTIFACGGYRIIRSADEGRQWDYPIGEILHSVGVVTLGGSYVSAVCDGDGVFISKDNGTTWSAANNGLTDLSMRCIAKDQFRNLVVGTRKGNVFRSSDYGKTWVQLGGAVTGLTFLQVGPSGRVYAGSFTGVYLWTGTVWKNVLTTSYLLSFAVDSKENLYAGVVSDSGKYCVAVSTNRGATWRNVTSLVTSAATVATYGDTVYAGDLRKLFRSTDKGATWTAVNCPSNISISCITHSSAHMLVIGGWSGEIFLSKDEGATWSQISSTEGLTIDAQIQSVQANSRGDLFATGGIRTYLWRSTDGGDHWKTMDIGLTHPYHLAFDDVLYATIQLEFGEVRASYRSMDNGDTWQTLVNGPGAVIGSGPGGCVFAQKFGPWGHGWTKTYDLQRSPDRGETWVSVGFDGKKVSSITYAGDSVFLALAAGTLYRSADLGRSWQAADPIIRGAIRSILPGGSGAVFVAGDSGIYVSLDRGNNWRQSAVESTILPVYTIAATAQGRVFAGTQRGVYLSVDDGGTWQAVGLDSLNVTGMVCGPHNEVLATTSNGIFCAKNDSLRWVNINAGLPAENRTSILLTSDGYAYATGPVVYKTRVAISQIDSLINAQSIEDPLPLPTPPPPPTSDSADVTIPPTPPSEEPSEKPTAYQLGQNYPNPFNPTTAISFSLPADGHVSLKIFDLLGREVATVVSENLPSGTYVRRWNAAGCPSGVYFYRLQAGAYVEAKRLLLVR